MAINAALTLEIDGTAVDTQLGDDFTQNNVNGDGPDVANTIELFSCSASCSVGTERLGGQAGSVTRQRSWSDVECVARIGKSTTHIAKALRLNSRIKATIRFFRMNHDSGATELIHTLTLDQARITRFNIQLPYTMAAETANLPLLMSFAIGPHTVTNESALGPADTDSWGAVNG